MTYDDAQTINRIYAAEIRKGQRIELTQDQLWKAVEYLVRVMEEEIKQAGLKSRETKAISELQAACRLALNAFEKNWAIDWHDIEKALENSEKLWGK